ncbi:ankyrin repeat domain-containing protein [Pectobacterium carotovorum subsp. carotovorum]|nr:hypothetical protein [Pectobacterium carotovorum]MCL6365266.1 ankyrin repeat domain-containing protein [Pectobacterium carotovorum subsp. carotovorum]
MYWSWTNLIIDNNLHEYTDSNGRNAVFHAIDPMDMHLLLLRGLDINHKDKYGRNILFYYWFQNENVIDLIIEKGIDFTIIDNDGYNFLSYGLFYFHPEKFISKKELFKENKVVIKTIYTDLEKGLKLLLENNFEVSLASTVLLGMPPENVRFHDTLRGILETIKNNNIDYTKTKFVFHDKDFFSENKSHIIRLYSFDSLYKLSKG